MAFLNTQGRFVEVESCRDQALGLFRFLFRLVFPARRRRRGKPSQKPKVVRSWALQGPIEPSRPSAASVPKAVHGPCYVIDGDTIDIRGVRIRLAGIDAPELDDPYGQTAKWRLVGLCKGVTIRAVLDGESTYERMVATCYLPDGRDLSAEMVKAGLAIDWRKFSGGKYRDLEPEGVRTKLWRCDARQKWRAPVKLPD